MLGQLDTCCYCACVTPLISTAHHCQPAVRCISTLQDTSDMVVLDYDIEISSSQHDGFLLHVKDLHILVTQSEILLILFQEQFSALFLLGT